MDPLYLDTPRPFSKFPAGYRPMSGGGNAIRTMSTLSLYPSRVGVEPSLHDRGISLSQMTLADIASNSPASYENYMRRTENSLLKDYNQWSLPTSPDSGMDPREDFRVNNFHKHKQPPLDRRSSDPVKSTLSGPALLAELGHSDEFLKKLRRQREKIENYGRQRERERDLAHAQRAPQSVERSNESKVAWRSNVDNRRGDANSNTVASSLLHKTQSDSSIFHDLIPRQPPSRNSDSANFHSFQSDTPRQYELIQRPASSMERRAPMEGFFALKNRRDPVWITDPPPPFEIQGDSRMPRPVYYPSKQYRNHVQAARESRTVLTHSGGGGMMDMKVAQVSGTSPPLSYDIVLSNQPSIEGPGRAGTEQQNTNFQPLNTIENVPPAAQFATFSPASKTEFYQIPSQNHQDSLQPISIPQEYYIDNSKDHSRQLLMRSPLSFNNSTAPTEVYYTSPPPRHSNTETVPQVSNFNGGNGTVDVAGAKFSQGNWNTGSSSGLGSGFHSMPRQVRQGPVRQKERSFAIMSRPLTPPAILQNVTDVVDPSLQAQYRRIAPNMAGDRSRRWARPNSPPTYAIPPDSLDNYNRNIGSPISSYDNESEAEFRSRPYLHSLPANHAQQIGSTPAHGILLRNHEGVSRPSKKVVFLCDSGKTIRYLHDNVVSMDAPPHVKAYDGALADVVEQWSSISDQIGGDVKIMKEKVTAVFNSLRFFLWTAASQPEPSADDVQKLVSPVVNLLSGINSFKDSRRNTPQFNHLCAVAEGIPAVGWVLVKKTPAPYIKEMLEASMFYINRILKEFKDGDQKNVEWARLWKTLLESMHTFVRQTHTTGLVWNSAPGCSPPPEEGSTPAPRNIAGGPPPPPPPPPPSLFADSAPPAAVSDASKASRDALFAEINKGEAITAGLRKVTADMQTHKNPALREQFRAPESHDPKPNSHPAPGPAKPTTKPHHNPPRVELKDGKQWNVEYIIGNPNVVVNVADKKQTVYIYKCEDSVIVIKGKLNSITLDSCRKTSVVFDAVVAQCETINCQRIEIQTLGEMPTISIQKTDGCQVYLSEVSKNAEIVTSKSSEMNVLIPKQDGDYIEFPIPEQFKTVFDGAKLITCVSDIS